MLCKFVFSRTCDVANL